MAGKAIPIMARDSVCPRCGKIGKKNLYQDGHGNIYVRWRHWDADLQTTCHIPKTDYEIVGKTT